MKKTLLFTACLAVLATGAALAQAPARDIAGNYSGTLTISLGKSIDGDALVMEGKSVSIEAVGDAAVDFTLPDFSFEGMSLGDIFLPGIPVYDAGDGSVRFGENEPVSFEFLGGMIQATARISSSGSAVRGGRADIDVDVVWTNSGGLTDIADMPIYVRFSGENEAVRFDLNRDGSVDVSDVSALVEYILTH
ncbi:MAG: calycin-like domain-containing protein [Alloprevotella sp.]|nr:calycin-like domain-containing protein [Alloprevotella sp.]